MRTNRRVAAGFSGRTCLNLIGCSHRRSHHILAKYHDDSKYLLKDDGCLQDLFTEGKMKGANQRFIASTTYQKTDAWESVAVEHNIRCSCATRDCRPAYSTGYLHISVLPSLLKSAQFRLPVQKTMEIFFIYLSDNVRFSLSYACLTLCKRSTNRSGI